MDIEFEILKALAMIQILARDYPIWFWNHLAMNVLLVFFIFADLYSLGKLSKRIKIQTGGK